MNSNEPAASGGDDAARDRQITALLEIVGSLAKQVTRLEARLATVSKTTGSRAAAGEDDEAPEADPAAWVWFTPPAAAEDQPTVPGDPRLTVDNFVTWYNLTFVGIDGGRAKPIPRCWPEHPGLQMEIAALAYSWRAANIGPNATERDAQAWLHQWRPGFADRLAREWVHPDCLDGDHRVGGPPARPDRFGLAEQHAAARKLHQRAM